MATPQAADRPARAPPAAATRRPPDAAGPRNERRERQRLDAAPAAPARQPTRHRPSRRLARPACARSAKGWEWHWQASARPPWP